MPRITSPIAEALSQLAAAFDDLGIGWYLFGAQAALLYGTARLTADIDVTVLLKNTSTESLARALENHDHELRITDPAFIQQTRVLPITHRPTAIPTDIVLGGPGLEEMFLARAQRKMFAGITVPVARAEDLIVMKVLAGRPKDLEDVVAIIAAQLTKGLDIELVRDTLTMLEEALGQSDLLPQLDALLKA